MAALIAAFACAGSAYAGTFPGRNGRIAFTANVGSRSQVFTMRANGGGVRQLTNEAAGAADPDWLPGGRELLYARSDGLAPLVGAGGNLVSMVSTQEPISDPATSPDGKRIVFTVNGDGLFDGPSIYEVNADGTQLQRMTSGSNPQWSPDGHWIAYVSVPADTGCSGVRLMEPDGSGDHPLAQGQPDANRVCHDGAEAPTFSPDSRRVLYVANGIKTQHKQNGSDLYTASIHGGAHKRLTRDDLDEASPAFSPDGKSVVFEATGGRGRQNGTFVISASGKHRHRIAPPHAGLSWQPLRAG
jgi:Tol biopolymer transport system component